MPNRNYPFSPQSEPLFYDPKLGYVTEKRLYRRSVRKDVSHLSFAALGLFVCSLLVSLFMSAVMLLVTWSGVQEAWNSFAASIEFHYLFSAFASVIGTATPFLIYLLFTRRGVDTLLQFEPVKFGTGALFVIGGCGACLLANIPAGWITALAEGGGLSPERPSLPVANTLVGRLLMFFAIAVIPAVFEEFAIRGVLLSTLRKYGDWFAIVTSAVLFGILHIDLSTISFAVLGGLIMGYIYVRTGNLFVSIAVHLLNNSISLILQILAEDLGEQAAMIATNSVFYGVILSGIVAIVILCIRRKLRFRLQNPVRVLSGWEKLACVLSNPGFILFLMLCAMMCVAGLFGVSLV